MLLAIVERHHLGEVETSFADVFYVARELHRQLGGVDLLLRAGAVDAAVTRPAPPPAPDPLPRGADPAGSVAALLQDGMRVFVTASDLTRCGLAGARLLPGVVPAADRQPDWDGYQRVWFL